VAYTINDLFKRACALVDSVVDDTGEVDTSTTADYKGRTLSLVDMCQKELGDVSDLFKIYEISSSNIPSMFGRGANTKVRQFEVYEDLEYECINGERGVVKSYYFEADSGNGTAYIEDYNGSWNTLATVTLDNTTVGFKVYSGNVTGTAGATKSRIRFSGSYHYNTVNVAIFDIAFESGKIPVYRAWKPTQLPADVYKIDNVKIEYSPNIYTNNSAYRVEWEDNRQTLYINYEFSGILKVQYRPFTTVPTAFTDTIEVDDLTAQCICYYLAMSFVSTEQNVDLRNQFRSQYENLKLQCKKDQPLTEVQIVDYYGGV
jgi:hypothetical protein